MLGPIISENDPPFLLHGSLRPTNLEKKSEFQQTKNLHTKLEHHQTSRTKNNKDTFLKYPKPTSSLTPIHLFFTGKIFVLDSVAVKIAV